MGTVTKLKEKMNDENVKKAIDDIHGLHLIYTDTFLGLMYDILEETEFTSFDKYYYLNAILYYISKHMEFGKIITKGYGIQFLTLLEFFEEGCTKKLQDILNRRDYHQCIEIIKLLESNITECMKINLMN